MRKILYIAICVLVFFFITNPGIKDLENTIPGYDSKNSQIVSTGNFLLFARYEYHYYTYYDNGGKYEYRDDHFVRKYIGVCKNYFIISDLWADHCPEGIRKIQP